MPLHVTLIVSLNSILKLDSIRLLITSRLLCALFFRPKHVTRIAKHPPLRHKREALESIYYSAFALLWREEDAGRKARCFIKGVDHRSNLLGYIPENRIESLGRS